MWGFFTTHFEVVELYKFLKKKGKITHQCTCFTPEFPYSFFNLSTFCSAIAKVIPTSLLNLSSTPLLPRPVQDSEVFNIIV